MLARSAATATVASTTEADGTAEQLHRPVGAARVEEVIGLDEPIGVGGARVAAVPARLDPDRARHDTSAVGGGDRCDHRCPLGVVLIG